MILALDWGEWSVSCPGHTFPSEKVSLVCIGWKAGWAQKPIWMLKLEENSFAPARNRTTVVQSVIRHCSDWVTPAYCLLPVAGTHYKIFNDSITYATYVQCHWTMLHTEQYFHWYVDHLLGIGCKTYFEVGKKVEVLRLGWLSCS